MEVRNIMSFREESYAEGAAKVRAELTPIIDKLAEKINELDEKINKLKDLNAKIKDSNVRMLN